MRDWVHHNREAFERDVLRDFCQAAEQLAEQVGRFAATQTISFSVLRAMIGEHLNKGLLWRLKDKAHHIFLEPDANRPAGLLLDWTLGYIFHESLKLMEDAHQQQYYAPLLEGFAGLGADPELSALSQNLMTIQSQTGESMRREVIRLNTLLLQTRKLFCLYFSGCSGHRPLARFLNDSNELARRTFQGDYERLITSVYADEPERMYVEAACSLLESARFAAAVQAAEAALAINPDCRAARSVKEAAEVRRPGNGGLSA